MLYLAIFFVLLVIYTILYWVDIKATLDYIRNEQDEWIVIYFYTRDGFLHYKYEIPLVSTENDRVKFKLVKGQGREIHTGTTKKDRLMPMDIYRKYVSIRTYLTDHKSMFEDIRRYLNSRDIHVELDIKLKQGTGDAALTGLTCGLLWAAAGIVITYLSRYLKAFKKRIAITPCFDKTIFEVDATCIFHVKLVHIIVVLIKIYYKKYLIKLKSKKTIGGEVSG
jgi:hypothetical protein